MSNLSGEILQSIFVPLSALMAMNGKLRTDAEEGRPCIFSYFLFFSTSCLNVTCYKHK